MSSTEGQDSPGSTSTRTDPSEQRLPIIIAAVAGVWIVALALGLLGPLAAITFPALTVTAIAATLVGVRRYQPRIRWPWYAFAAGFALYLIGGITRDAFNTLGDLTSHRSLVPDLVTIPGYFVIFAALIGFVRARHSDRATRITWVSTPPSPPWPPSRSRGCS